MKTPPFRKSRSQTHLNAKAIANQARRRLYARQAKPHGGVLFGLGFVGLVGWSVVVPTLLGMALGIWIDFKFPNRFSWTLALMLAGLSIGCLMAWEWVSQEQQRMVRDQAPGQTHPNYRQTTIYINKQIEKKMKAAFLEDGVEDFSQWVEERIEEWLKGRKQG